MDFPGGSEGKESPAMRGELSSIPGSESVSFQQPEGTRPG